MTIWNWLFGGDAMPGTDQALVSSMDINPATGLPMLDGCGGLDVGGNDGADGIQHLVWCHLGRLVGGDPVAQGNPSH